MSICINKIERRIAVPIDGGQKVILILREPTASESMKFLKAVIFDTSDRKEFARVIEFRVHFIDQLLTGVEALDENGEPDNITYMDGDEEKQLTPDVVNWKQLLHPSWKIAASQKLEGQFQAEEETALKN